MAGQRRLAGMTAPTASTLAILIDVVATEGPTTSRLTTMLDRAGLSDYDSGARNRQELLRRPLQAARKAAEQGNTAAHRALLTFIARFVTELVPNPARADPWFEELREALRADGYELTWEQETDAYGFGSDATYKIHPTDATPVALAPEITALEAELIARGYATALNHYQQAADGLLNHKYESANGDLRATLEDLVTRLAEDHTGYQRTLDSQTGQPRANQGRSAINHLVQGGHLAEDDGGKLLQGLWAMTHTKGSHPGHSDADEARFRMQTITATARFLLKHFPATP
jgi:hypothetical protein